MLALSLLGTFVCICLSWFGKETNEKRFPKIAKALKRATANESADATLFKPLMINDSMDFLRQSSGLCDVFCVFFFFSFFYFHFLKKKKKEILMKQLKVKTFQLRKKIQSTMKVMLAFYLGFCFGKKTQMRKKQKERKTHKHKHK